MATLDAATQDAAFWLVWAARTAGYPVIITSARRTVAIQRDLVRRGLSNTLKSKHVDGKAFDIDWLGFNRNNIPKWFWPLIGPWAEVNLGLRWGGRFNVGGAPDFGHFELR